ncbi:MAG: hypothetical protein M3021_00165, partial [Actinomycetota bacterium]|nr:hypothetical protein [Actinomycetota bacterium]
MRRPPAALLITLTILLLAACDMSQRSGPNNGGFVPNPGGGGTGTGSNTIGNPGGSIPQNAAKPAPPQNDYNGCPSSGDGGDPELNTRKDRTDSAPWYPVKIG